VYAGLKSSPASPMLARRRTLSYRRIIVPILGRFSRNYGRCGRTTIFLMVSDPPAVSCNCASALQNLRMATEHNFIYDFKDDTAPKALKVLFRQSPPEAILCHGRSDYGSALNRSQQLLQPTGVSARSYRGARRDGCMVWKTLLAFLGPPSTADHISQSRHFAICYLSFHSSRRLE
jgi:hypothetical protein